MGLPLDMTIRRGQSPRQGRVLGASLAAVLVATFTAALSSAAAPATAALTVPGAGVVDVPVSFKVFNRNNTGIPCQQEPDGGVYTVHASLVAPRDLIRPSSPAVAVYLHGLGYSSFFWHLTEVPQYDYARTQAEQGHVSLVIDRLGNPAHDELQDGNNTCLPAQADIANQIIEQLREGAYTTTGSVTPRFGRVLLIGHSAGGLIAELTQAVYGTGEALAVIGYHHYPSALTVQQFSAAGQDCLTSPQPAGGNSGAPNYAPFGRTDTDFAAAHFHDVEPAVADVVLRKRNRDACGDLLSGLQGVLGTYGASPLIQVPVLLLTGEKDALFPPPGGALQTRTGYPGAHRLSVVELPGTGHAMTFGRTHETFRQVMGQWLAENHA